MVGETIRHYTGKGTNLGQLEASIQDYLKSEGFSVQASQSSTHGMVIQAKKGGFLAGVIDADRALTVLISGAPDDFTVRVGVGKWLKDLAVSAIETLALSSLFLVVDVAEMAWNVEIEQKLARKIDGLVA